MFNSHSRDFDDDPFFSDVFRAHRENMRQMMRSFSEPMGGPSMPSIMDGRNRGDFFAEDRSSTPSLRDEHRDVSRSLLPFVQSDSTDMMRNPFNGIDSMMANTRRRMQEMQRNIANAPMDGPNTHSFHSSSVMTYSKVGNEPPKVFQASSTTRHVPGGIKETRKAIKDSESGVEKMSIGHHIRDRGHVVEKKVNKKTGEKELNQDFDNIDESEAQSFEDEWQKGVAKLQPPGARFRAGEALPRAVNFGAVRSPERANREQPKAKAEQKNNMKGFGLTKH